MRLYLAGPMSGIDQFNFPLFLSAAEDLRFQGHDIISPAERVIEAQSSWDYRSNDLEGFDVKTAVRWNLEQILDDKTEGIVLLPDWRHSSGSQVEYRLNVQLGKPAFDYVPGGMREVLTGHPEFHRLLTEISTLYAVKQHDYGKTSDPFANIKASEEWGIQPWVGAMVRLNDKVRRLQMFAQRGDLANESAEDSMLDIACYALIALVLYRDEATA